MKRLEGFTGSFIVAEDSSVTSHSISGLISPHILQALRGRALTVFLQSLLMIFPQPPSRVPSRIELNRSNGWTT